MTQSEIATRLRRLSEEMETIAVAMDYYGGFADWAQHALELMGAAAIAAEWADEIDGCGK